MDTEDWKDFKKKGDEIKQHRLERHRKQIYSFAMINKLRYAAVQPWHLRISNDEVSLDLFPKAKRYHNLSTGKRGTYHSLKGFLKSIFKI